MPRARLHLCLQEASGRGRNDYNNALGTPLAISSPVRYKETKRCETSGQQNSNDCVKVHRNTQDNIDTINNYMLGVGENLIGLVLGLVVLTKVEKHTVCDRV